MLEPGHPEDHGVNPDRGDVKGVALRNAGNREVKSDLTIRMQENTAVGNGDLDWRTWFGRYVEKRHDIFMDKIERRA